MSTLFTRAQKYFHKHGIGPSARLLYRKMSGKVPWNIARPRTNSADYIADHARFIGLNPPAPAVPAVANPAPATEEPPATADTSPATEMRSSKMIADEIELGFARPVIQAVKPANELFGRGHIVIIGDLNLPQCRKYRVVQKAEAMEKMGLVASFSHWQDIPRCINLMQVATTIILYRVQHDALVEQYCKEARRLGIMIGYDIDDPVFDSRTYGANENLNTLDPAEKRQLLNGCPSYAAAIRLADFTIVSTPGMARLMEQYHSGPIHVWRNAIDIDTRQAALDFHTVKAARKTGIRIGYASGSRAHNLDFAVAESALVRVLSEFPDVELAIVGYHTPSKELAAFAGRITQTDFQDYPSYISNVASFDISIIPLLMDAFNDCKSAIRFLESSVVGVPSVSSNIGDFSNIVSNGKTGYLASTAEDWYEALVKLIGDADLRKTMGAAAKAYVTAEMYSETIAARLDRELLRVIRND
jgi:glycosyltransferase involved in cell wall biosynthesis